MRSHTPFKHSLVFKLLLAICVILVPLIVMLIINNHYSKDIIRNQVSQSNKSMLNLHMQQIDTNLQVAGNYLYQLSENDALLYYQANLAEDYHEYSKAKIRLFNAISSQSEFYPVVDSVFIYSPIYNEMINTQNFEDSYRDRTASKEEIQQLLEGNPDELLSSRWNIWKGKDDYFLLYLIRGEDYYVGAWLNIEKLITPFKFIDIGDSGRALITTADFTPITQKQYIKEKGIDLIPDSNMYSISGSDEPYLVISEPSSIASFHITTLIPEKAILDKLPLLQYITIFITIGAVLFLLLFAFLMRKIFLIPIQQIVMAMKQLRKGNLEVRLPIGKSSTEFEMMNESFNKMITDIKSLKVDVYEKKINLQRAELQHLQLQINPHFFLNSLNIIYNLATVKEFSLIQQMSKSLADYFRFMFKSNSYFVSLKDELKHTENYLTIQQLRFPNGFTYSVDAVEELLKYKIPPLVIQSLVENSIKHAFNMEDPIDISIHVKSDQDDDNFMCIQIQDTGEGFPDEVLQALKENELLVIEEGKRIGIWNIKRRLHLLYGENQASIQFENRQDTGATIHIRLPKKMF